MTGGSSNGEHPGAGQRPAFAWHPNYSSAEILAVADIDRIYFAHVPEAVADTQHFQCDASSDILPSGVVSLQSPGSVTALAFAADGDKLAAVVSQNQVRLAFVGERREGVDVTMSTPAA